MSKQPGMDRREKQDRGKKREEELEFVISQGRDELQPSGHGEIPKGVMEKMIKKDGNSLGVHKGGREAQGRAGQGMREGSSSFGMSLLPFPGKKQLHLRDRFAPGAAPGHRMQRWEVE